MHDYHHLEYDDDKHVLRYCIGCSSYMLFIFIFFSVCQFMRIAG